MKANEAPDNIWVRPNAFKTPYPLYIDENSNYGGIEYIRTDAFIEKATEWLKKNADNYTWYNEMEGESGMTDEFIDDFKKYLKGE